MSTENEPQEEAAPASGGAKKMLIIALTVGLLVGAAAGSFVVGPLVAEGPAKPKGESGDCSAVMAQHGVATAPASVHTIDNLVLNPAHSGGTRYLMASVGFGLTDLHGAEQMALRDAEVRDIVLRVLGSKSVGELSDLSLRNGIKEEMRAEVVKVVGEHALVDIYFPQFVIQ